MMSYVGHGGAAVWASENVLNSWDPPKLLAQSRQPLMMTFNCLNGYFVAPNYDALAEAFLKHVIGAVLEDCPDDMAFFEQRIDEDVLKRLEHVLESPFEHLTYSEAIEILQASQREFEYPMK